ncbi:MAG: hypothetical protein ABI597_13675 [Gammaproteobacteria bacterium]
MAVVEVKSVDGKTVYQADVQHKERGVQFVQFRFDFERNADGNMEFFIYARKIPSSDLLGKLCTVNDLKNPKKFDISPDDRAVVIAHCERALRNGIEIQQKENEAFAKGVDAVLDAEPNIVQKHKVDIGAAKYKLFKNKELDIEDVYKKVGIDRNATYDDISKEVSQKRKEAFQSPAGKSTPQEEAAFIIILADAKARLNPEAKQEGPKKT